MKYTECSICVNNKLIFVICFQCNNTICFSCFKKLDKCPYCRREYITSEHLLKYIVNIKKYIKNYNKTKSIKFKNRKKARFKKNNLVYY